MYHDLVTLKTELVEEGFATDQTDIFFVELDKLDRNQSQPKELEVFLNNQIILLLSNQENSLQHFYLVKGILQCFKPINSVSSQAAQIIVQFLSQQYSSPLSLSDNQLNTRVQAWNVVLLIKDLISEEVKLKVQSLVKQAKAQEAEDYIIKSEFLAGQI